MLLAAERQELTTRESFSARLSCQHRYVIEIAFEVRRHDAARVAWQSWTSPETEWRFLIEVPSPGRFPQGRTAGPIPLVECLVAQCPVGCAGSHGWEEDATRRGSAASHKPKGTSLGVLANGQAVSGVDHGAPELHHALKSPRNVTHNEIWKREGVARPGAALMHTYPGGIGTILPALSLATLARNELDSQHSLPESERALRIIGWKLNEGDERVSHAPTIAAGIGGQREKRGSSGEIS